MKTFYVIQDADLDRYLDKWGVVSIPGLTSLWWDTREEAQVFLNTETGSAPPGQWHVVEVEAAQ